MNNRIAQALTKLFDRHRIVFWYDAKQELRDDFETLSLSGVEKLELTNNEYSVKYRIIARAARAEVPALPRRASARRSG